MKPKAWQLSLFILFTLSGFAGLIYEAIWAHYLKLFLGHAAYAQTLVLSIFMGGMAIGAWIASRLSPRWGSPLRAYAIIELIIGLFGLGFHHLYQAGTNLAYLHVIPGLDAAWSVQLFKWTFAALLILPQSVLLGMTFPLMSAALLRRFPQTPGFLLAMLYFTNSIGGAIGVLVSGFVLIERVGLPGTVLTAGLLNIGLALAVWALAKHREQAVVAAVRPVHAHAKAADSQWLFVLLVASALTGAASFMYEIGWVRMLNLVLGTTTHSFELMLSAFILGLALGGLWIRRRIDSLKRPVSALALVQLMMGLLALSTLVLYNGTFDLMASTMQVLNKTENGYRAFILWSHALSLLVMLPTTFCAGMTLPLVTHVLVTRGHGEQSVGAVYATNTLGAIAGIFVAVHLAIPILGLKGVIMLGALVDLSLGVFLLQRSVHSARRPTVLGAAAVAALALLTVGIMVQLDPRYMASGVFRYGQAMTLADSEVVYHRDGKTATVNLVEASNGVVSILTNGKPDASINLSGKGEPSLDEYTQILLGAIPLGLTPDAKRAAVIGMGSGMTSHVLLSSDTLLGVDTIEIEPAMVEAAQVYSPRVSLVFSASHGNIHYEDARTFFSTYNKTYDLIVSEPSNPWVSGVANLFSQEFYRLVKSHLSASGSFAQWLHLYEIDMPLLASVLKAISSEFNHYVLYAVGTRDVLVVATNGGPLNADLSWIFSLPRVAEELDRIAVRSPEDLYMLRIASDALLKPLIRSYDVPPNSDFFPILDLNAPKTRFLNRDALELLSLAWAPVPMVDMLDRQNSTRVKTSGSKNLVFPQVMRAHRALALHALILQGAVPHKDFTISDRMRLLALLTSSQADTCQQAETRDLWFDALYNLSAATIPFIDAEGLASLWKKVKATPCYSALPISRQRWVALFEAVSQRNAPVMTVLAQELLRAGTDKAVPRRQGFLLATAMVGELSQGRPERALHLWQVYAPTAIGDGEPSIYLRLLHAHSAAGVEHSHLTLANTGN